MTDEIKKFESLLNRYELTDNTSENIQRLILKSGKENLRSILKKTGQYTLIFAVTMKLFYLIKKTGISITLIQTRILLLILSVSTFTSTSFGVYKIKVYISDHARTDNVSLYNAAPDNGNTISTERSHNEGTEPVKKRYNTGIANFTGDSESLEVTYTLYKMIKKYKSNSDIVMLDKSGRNRVNKIITGSLRIIGDKKILTARIIEVNDSKVVYAIDEIIESENQIEKACGAIAEAIAEKI